MKRFTLPNGSTMMAADIKDAELVVKASDLGCQIRGIPQEVVEELFAFVEAATSDRSQNLRSLLGWMVISEMARVGIARLPVQERGRAQAALERAQRWRQSGAIITRMFLQPPPPPTHPLNLECEALVQWCEHAASIISRRPGMPPSIAQAPEFIASTRAALSSPGWLKALQIVLLMDIVRELWESASPKDKEEITPPLWYYRSIVGG